MLFSYVLGPLGFRPKSGPEPSLLQTNPKPFETAPWSRASRQLARISSGTEITEDQTRPGSNAAGLLIPSLVGRGWRLARGIAWLAVIFLLGVMEFPSAGSAQAIVMLDRIYVRGAGFCANHCGLGCGGGRVVFVLTRAEARSSRSVAF